MAPGWELRGSKLPPPEIATIRTRGNSRTIRAMASTPLSFGMMMSVMTTSAGTRCSSSRASVALSTIRTEKPARSSTRLMPSRTSASSSITRTLGPIRVQGFLGLRGLGDRRKQNSEGRPGPRGGLYRDASTKTFHNSMDHGTSKPRPLTDRPGREKRLEDALHRALLHAMSGIGHPEVDAPHGKLGGRRYTQGHDQNAVRALHCLIGIGAQVRDESHGERGVGTHHGNVLGNFRAYFDARRGECRKKQHALRYHAAQIERCRLGVAKPVTEGQNFLHHILRPARGRQNAHE